MEMQASTRVAVTEGLMQLAAADPRVVLVCTDSETTLKAGRYREAFPDRFFEVGLAEQHAVAFAAGLASCGMMPWVASFAVFLTMRACEQVRSFVAYPHLNVKFVGANGGIAGGEREGVTHQAIEDIGILRTIPGMTIVVPADANQVRQAVQVLGRISGPAYIRIGSGRDPIVFSNQEVFEVGRIRVLTTLGNDVALFSNGYMLQRTLEAARQLAADGLNATVVEVHTLKPLDADGIAHVLRLTKAAVTVEDHNIIGGLGSAVSEVIAEQAPAVLARIGLRDVFAESGSASALLDKYHMGVDDIVEAARIVVETKRR